MSESVIRLENICKSYIKIKNEIKVLNNLSISFEAGKLYAIMGPSGCGKSTLFNILGLIDGYDCGNYELFDKDINNYSDAELSKLRMENIGFIFQEFQLDPYLNAVENVMMPLYINKKVAKDKRKEMAISMLERFNLQNRIEHFPDELSGGEQQRVAIARALVNNPTIILADEPTGNLDESMQKDIFELLKDLSKQGKCVIVVSHNSEIKNYADVVYNLSGGTLKEF